MEEGWGKAASCGAKGNMKRGVRVSPRMLGLSRGGGLGGEGVGWGYAKVLGGVEVGRDIMAYMELPEVLALICQILHLLLQLAVSIQPVDRYPELCPGPSQSVRPVALPAQCFLSWFCKTLLFITFSSWELHSHPT